MLLNKITVRNLRAFRDGTDLHVRPLTLVYGENNVGKSALIRTLPLIADSLVGTSRDALEMSRRLAFLDADYLSLRWAGEHGEGSNDISLGLEFGGAVDGRVQWELHQPLDWGRTVVRVVEVTAGEESAKLHWEMRAGEERSPQLTYRVSSGAEEKETRLRFDGLLPPVVENDGAVLNWARTQMLGVRDGVMWLHSTRSSPSRRVSWAGGVRWSLESDGSDAPVVLADEPEVLAEVSAWYADALGVDLTVRRVGAREVEVTVQRLGGAGPKVGLIDCGEGPGQILSVVTAAAMVKRHAARGGPSILAIEEPESHLHPTVQEKLADLLCSVARTPGVRIVLETHSAYLLFAVQKNLAGKRIEPELVGLHWVRQYPSGVSKADFISVDDEGRFVGPWPPEAFTTDLSLLAEIERLREGQS